MPCWCSKTFWRRSGNRSNEKEGLSLLFFVTAPCEDSPPLRPNIFLGLAAPTPLDMQALRESMAKPCSAPRVTFPTRGNHQRCTKGCRPWTPAIAKFPPSLVLRCACTRAASCHNKRPICHFKLAGKSVFYFSPSLTGVTLPAVNPWRGRGIPRTLDGLTHHNQSC